MKEVGPSLGVRVDTVRPMKRGGAIPLDQFMRELYEMNLKEIMSLAAVKEVNCSLATYKVRSHILCFAL